MWFVPHAAVRELQLLVFKTLPVGWLLIVYERHESDHAISRHLVLFFFFKPTWNLPHGLTLISARTHSKEFLVFSKPVCMSWLNPLLARRRALEPVAEYLCTGLYKGFTAFSSIHCADCASQWHLQLSNLCLLFSFVYRSRGHSVP